MNDTFLRACKGDKVYPTPVWIMRQAGRYLPEYQKIREKVDFLTLCRTPELAAEVTLQPVDILGVDAAILFSDILIFMKPMGIDLQFDEGKGPMLTPKIRSLEEFQKLRPIAPETDVHFVLETIKILRENLKDKVPLIGFAGAPFTLATYMIEGGTSKSFVNTKKMMYSNPDLFASLMELLTDCTIKYLNAQIEAGAQAIQLFDTWAGVLTSEDYRHFVLPYIKRIVDNVRKPSIPFIFFAYDAVHLFGIIKDLHVDVVGIDWRLSVKAAVSFLGYDKVIQGNLDPCALFLPEEILKEKISNILEDAKNAKSHIFNLGHGILPECPPEKAKFLVNCVHELSKKYEPVGSEKRTDDRVDFKILKRVFFEGEDALKIEIISSRYGLMEGFLKDISKGGMQLYLTTPISMPLDTKVRLRFIIGARQLIVNAVLKWKAPTDSYYSGGFRFEDLSVRDLDFINRLYTANLT